MIFILSAALLLAAGKTHAQKHVHDTVLIKTWFDRGTALSSTNPDSAMHYAELAEKLAAAKNYQQWLSQAVYLKAKVSYFVASYDRAREYDVQALAIAERNADQPLMAKCYNLAGAIQFNLGNFDKALEQYHNRLKISAALGDTVGMIQAYYNITLIYSSEGDHKKTIEATFKAIDIAEKKRDTANLSGLYEGLGMAYSAIGEPDKAIRFLNKAYQFALMKDEEYTQGGILIDYGNVYQAINDNKRALQYYSQAEAVTRKNGDKRRLAVALSNKATSTLLMKDIKAALKIYEEAIALNREINYPKGLSDSYGGKAECLLALGQPAEALKYALLSKDLIEEIKARQAEYVVYNMLSRVYEALHDNANAFLYFKKFVGLRDSLENGSALRSASEIEFSIEKQKIEKQKQYEQSVADKELRKQKQIRNIILVAGIIMLGLLVFIWRGYRRKRKANDKIVRQKMIIEDQNNDILQSISYARRIQEAMLTPPEEIKKLLPESFVIYRPKDIVSGDFYFIEPVFSVSGADRWVAAALADCTGHGVPGALMSLTGYNILRQSLKEKDVHGPGEALDYLNRELSHFLKQSQKETQIRDGMDISFAAINFEKRILSYAGANNPLWIVSLQAGLCDANGNALKEINSSNGYRLYEIKATKQPIGYSEKTEAFKTHEIQLLKGDQVYLFTDGYADQFGGPRGKKFKYKQLEQVILDNAHQRPKQQKQALEAAFDAWKQNHEQVDDVSIIGIKFG